MVPIIVPIPTVSFAVTSVVVVVWVAVVTAISISIPMPVPIAVIRSVRRHFRRGNHLDQAGATAASFTWGTCKDGEVQVAVYERQKSLRPKRWGPKTRYTGEAWCELCAGFIRGVL